MHSSRVVFKKPSSAWQPRVRSGEIVSRKGLDTRRSHGMVRAVCAEATELVSVLPEPTEH
jgi:hypothetical protein